MYHCVVENFDSVVDWFSKNRTGLVLKSIVLVDSHRRNPLHYLCEAAGDPRLAQLYLKHCGRFIDPDLEDDILQTPIFKLLQRNDISAPDAPRYHRALELVDLLVRQAAVGNSSAQIQQASSTSPAAPSLFFLFPVFSI